MIHIILQLHMFTRRKTVSNVVQKEHGGSHATTHSNKTIMINYHNEDYKHKPWQHFSKLTGALASNGEVGTNFWAATEIKQHNYIRLRSVHVSLYHLLGTSTSILPTSDFVDKKHNSTYQASLSSWAVSGTVRTWRLPSHYIRLSVTGPAAILFWPAR